MKFLSKDYFITGNNLLIFLHEIDDEDIQSTHNLKNTFFLLNSFCVTLFYLLSIISVTLFRFFNYIIADFF